MQKVSVSPYLKEGDIPNPLTSSLVLLSNRSRLLANNLGGLFADLPISTFHSVLDINCGPGQWVTDVAFHYPHIEVAGIDERPTMIAYANTSIRSQKLFNASFECMDLSHPLAFSSATFDLVNAILPGYDIPRTTWPHLLQECFRILKPGGILRILDTDGPVSNKPEAMRLGSLLNKALWLSGYGFSSDGSSLGMMHTLEDVFLQAGFQDLHLTSYALDCSRSSSIWFDILQDFQLSIKLTLPLLPSLSLTTADDAERLYGNLLIEAREDDFICTWPFLNIWGRKPLLM